MSEALAAVEVIRDCDRAGVLLHPTRIRMLELLSGPDSAAGLARRLGLPRQQVNYHLRELEREGLVELVEERRRGNFMERLVRASARSYLISPEALGRLGAAPCGSQDRFSLAYLVSAAARIIRDLAVLRARALEAGRRVATLTLETEVHFAGPDQRAAFAEELTREVARIAARYQAPQGPGARTFRLVLGCYPQVAEGPPEPGPAPPVRLE